MTPLQIAVKYHQGVIVRRLIDIYNADPNACKAPDIEFIQVTLIPHGLQKLPSFVKLQPVSQYIADIVQEQPDCWKVFMDSIKTDDAGTPPIVAAFQSKQYVLVKFLIQNSANYKPLFEPATLEDICQFASVPLMQEFIHNQLHTTQIDYKTVLSVVVKLRNTDLMNYFLTYHQIQSWNSGKGCNSSLSTAFSRSGPPSYTA